MLKAAFIGTGANPDNPGPRGYAMAYQHAEAFAKLADCEMVACVDLVRKNAEKFADRFGIDNVYVDYVKMLDEIKPDIVSVCTWIEAHAEIVIKCAEKGVAAIHCEKPMATTWKEAKLMTEKCEEYGVNLTFNHQRRFGTPWRQAKKLLDQGEIGDLQKLQFSVGNLYEYGTHSFDLCGYFNDEIPAQWAIAQIDYRDKNLVFGTHNENQAFALWQYENGVFGMASTGKGSDLIGCQNRLVGTEGVIEVFSEDGPELRIKRAGSTEWENIDCPPQKNYINKAIADIVEALQEGKESELCASNALKATEIIFACFESARKRGRVDLPLEIEDNPLESMVEKGMLNPE